jgi:hypothetical protein
MWWTLTRHATSDQEVSRTLTALRVGDSDEGAHMPLLDRWATFLAFGYLLQYEQEKEDSKPALALAGGAATTTASGSHSAPSSSASSGTDAGGMSGIMSGEFDAAVSVAPLAEQVRGALHIAHDRLDAAARPAWRRVLAALSAHRPLARWPSSFAKQDVSDPGRERHVSVLPCPVLAA